MVLKNKKGKEFIEVNEEEVIYKGLVRNVIIKKLDIRSVFYDNKILAILTYKGQIYRLSLGPLSLNEKVKLEELRNELNKENILFNYTNAIKQEPLLSIAFINAIVINLDNQVIAVIIVTIILIFSLMYGKLFNTKVLYNIDKEEFEITRRNRTIKYKKYEVDKLELKKYTNENYLIKFSKNGKAYNLLFKDNPYLIKIYNVSLSKLFSEK